MGNTPADCFCKRLFLEQILEEKTQIDSKKTSLLLEAAQANYSQGYAKGEATERYEQCRKHSASLIPHTLLSYIPKPCHFPVKTKNALVELPSAPSSPRIGLKPRYTRAWRPSWLLKFLSSSHLTLCSPAVAHTTPIQPPSLSGEGGELSAVAVKGVIAGHSAPLMTEGIVYPPQMQV